MLNPSAPAGVRLGAPGILFRLVAVVALLLCCGMVLSVAIGLKPWAVPVIVAAYGGLLVVVARPWMGGAK